MGDLSRSCKEHKLVGLHCVFGVADKHAYSQQIEVPAKIKASLLEQQLLFIAHEHCPYPLDNLAYDYQLMTETEETKTYLFVAAKKEQLNQHKTKIIHAGLKPLIADIDQYALCRAVQALTEQQNFTLFYFDRESLSLMRVISGIPDFVRHVAMNSTASTDEKHSAMNRLLAFMNSTGANENTLPVYVSGDADLTGLDKRVLSPNETDSCYTRALGLALRGVNHD